jgi:hypothetical protein
VPPSPPPEEKARVCRSRSARERRIAGGWGL